MNSQLKNEKKSIVLKILEDASKDFEEVFGVDSLEKNDSMEEELTFVNDKISVQEFINIFKNKKNLKKLLLINCDINLLEIGQQKFKTSCRSLVHLEITNLVLGKSLSILYNKKAFKHLKSLKLTKCDITEIDEFCTSISSSSTHYFDKIEIVNCIMNRDTMSYVLMMIDCTREFVLIADEGQPKIRQQLRNLLLYCQSSLEKLRINGITLSLFDKESSKDNQENDTKLSQSISLDYLNLSSPILTHMIFENCITSWEAKPKVVTILNFAINCPSLKVLSLRKNKLVRFYLPDDSENKAKPYFLIDLRENCIKNILNSKFAEFYSDCTILLWNNEIEKIDDNTEVNYPYHIYAPTESSDEFFSKMIYE